MNNIGRHRRVRSPEGRRRKRVFPVIPGVALLGFTLYSGPAYTYLQHLHVTLGLQRPPGN